MSKEYKSYAPPTSSSTSSMSSVTSSASSVSSSSSGAKLSREQERARVQAMINKYLKAEGVPVSEKFEDYLVTMPDGKTKIWASQMSDEQLKEYVEDPQPAELIETDIVDLDAKINRVIEKVNADLENEKATAAASMLLNSFYDVEEDVAPAAQASPARAASLSIRNSPMASALPAQAIQTAAFVERTVDKIGELAKEAAVASLAGQTAQASALKDEAARLEVAAAVASSSLVEKAEQKVESNMHQSLKRGDMVSAIEQSETLQSLKRQASPRRVKESEEAEIKVVQSASLARENPAKLSSLGEVRAAPNLKKSPPKSSASSSASSASSASSFVSIPPRSSAAPRSSSPRSSAAPSRSSSPRRSSGVSSSSSSSVGTGEPNINWTVRDFINYANRGDESKISYSRYTKKYIAELLSELPVPKDLPRSALCDNLSIDSRVYDFIKCNVTSTNKASLKATDKHYAKKAVLDEIISAFVQAKKKVSETKEAAAKQASPRKTSPRKTSPRETGRKEAWTADKKDVKGLRLRYQALMNKLNEVTSRFQEYQAAVEADRALKRGLESLRSLRTASEAADEKALATAKAMAEKYPKMQMWAQQYEKLKAKIQEKSREHLVQTKEYEEKRNAASAKLDAAAQEWETAVREYEAMDVEESRFPIRNVETAEGYFLVSDRIKAEIQTLLNL